MKTYLSADRIGMTFSHKKGTVEALTDVSLAMGRSECVSLLGPSGCGKSTFLRIIAGILAPSSGSISIGNLTPKEASRRLGIGLAFQQPRLLPWRTLLENTLLPTEVREAPTQSTDARERARDLLSLLGLDQFFDSYPHQLSGGMLQRAALARALLLQPAVLLLDEPFSALDEITRERVWIDCRRVWQRDMPTLVLVTHNVREAVFFGDRVVLMSRRPGTILKDFEIPFGSERNRDVLASPELQDLSQDIRNEIFGSDDYVA